MKKLKINGKQTQSILLGKNEFVLDIIRKVDDYYGYKMAKDDKNVLIVYFKKVSLFKYNTLVYLNGDIIFELVVSEEGLVKVIEELYTSLGIDYTQFYLRNHKFINELYRIYNINNQEVSANE